MRITRRRRQLDSSQHSGALAAISRERHHPQPRIGGSHCLQLLERAVGTAIDYHPHRLPLLTRRAHRFIDFRAGVIAGDQHQMGCGALRIGGNFRHWQVLV